MLGDGDGRFVEQFLRANRHATLDVVDSSAAMLKLLRRRIVAIEGAEQRVNVTCCDVFDFLPDYGSGIGVGVKQSPSALHPSGYDLVVTHFFLDCFSTVEIDALLRRIRPHLTADVCWVLSEFAIPPGGPGLRRFAPVAGGLVVGGLYRAFGVITGLRARNLPDHTQSLTSAGFKLVARGPRLCGLLCSELWRLASPLDSEFESDAEENQGCTEHSEGSC